MDFWGMKIYNLVMNIIIYDHGNKFDSSFVS